jgi:hypothetical protein
MVEQGFCLMLDFKTNSYNYYNIQILPNLLYLQNSVPK